MRAFHLILKLLVAAGLALPGAAAQAQGFPAKPVHIVVPFGTGGPSDLLARLLQPRLSEGLGQPVVVENRVGAGGTIGTAMVASAAPDGYTLLQVASSHAVNASFYEKLPYHSVRSFAPVILLSTAPYVVAVYPPLAVKTVDDLIREAKARPGQLSYGSGGIGSGSHITGAMFASMAGIDITHVPYKGLGPTYVDLMAGRTQIVFSPLLPAMPFLESGKLRAIAVTGAGRLKSRPDLPNAAETLPGYRAMSWDGIFAPAGTPREVVARINAEYRKILDLPEIRKTFSDQAMEPSGGTPEAFGVFVESEVARFAKVVKGLGIRADNQ